MNTRTFSGALALLAVIISFALVNTAAAQATSSGNTNSSTTLAITLDTAPTVPRGSSNVALANISFSGLQTGSAVAITSIPVTISAGNSGSTANLLNCKVRDPQNVDGSLTGSLSLANGGASAFVFTSPYVVFANTSLSLACDIQPAAAIGSTFTISIDPAQVVAKNAVTGASFTPTSTTSSLAGSVIVTDSVGTGTGDATGTATGIPGIPNTGFGGALASSLLVLLAAAIVALVSGTYLRRSLK